MIPDTEKIHSDVIDLIIEASQTLEEVENEEGKMVKQLVIDPETIWWKTQLVNSPTFGRFAFFLKELQRKGTEAYNHMSKSKAVVFEREIDKLVLSYRYSIDAKSSESRRDRNNTQSTLIDKINRYKIEKQYTVKGEAKKSLMEGMIGKEGEKEASD